MLAKIWFGKHSSVWGGRAAPSLTNVPHRSDRYRVRTAILSGSCIPACAKGTPKRGQEAAPGTAALAVSGLALVAYGGRCSAP